MKKLITLFAAIAIISLVVNGKENIKDTDKSSVNIKFETPVMVDVLALAKAENKPILVEVSTEWCGYCKRMKANVYTDASVADYYNANLINVSFDGEKGEGVDLVKKYNIKGYPSFVYLNPDGSIILQKSGFQKASKFLELGKSLAK